MTPRSSEIRFKVEPRDVPATKAARRLGITEAHFEEVKDRLFARGFPRPDADTGLYDLKAIDHWQDARSGLTVEGSSRDGEKLALDRFNAFNPKPSRRRAKA